MKQQLLNPVLGNNLLMYNILNQKESGVSLLDNQQKKLKAMLSFFYQQINQGKNMDQNQYKQKFLSTMNIQLFGFLGSEDYLTEEFKNNPFSDTQMASKTLFYEDIQSLGQEVSQWTFKGDKVYTRKDKAEDFSFFADSASLEIFSVLKLTYDFIYSRQYKTAAGINFGLQAATMKFGTYWGEKRYGFNMNKFSTEDWSPTKTAKELNHALSVENTLTRVEKVIQSTRNTNEVNIINTEYHQNKAQLSNLLNIKKITYRNKNLGTTTFLNRVRPVSYELDVKKISALEQFTGIIPADSFRAIENFIELNAVPLQYNIPFLLTPQFYVLEGPIQINYRIIEDPIVILIFREFPNYLIPVEAWLPEQKEDNTGNLQTGLQINQFNSRLVFEEMAQKRIHTINGKVKYLDSGSIEAEPVLKYDKAELQRHFNANRLIR